MVSNALSVQSFDTKTPVICKPPPWPPALPPPPINQAHFFVFATLYHEHPTAPVEMAASCKLKWYLTYNAWWGTSSNDPTAERIDVYLKPTPLQPTYAIQVNYWWPVTHAWYYIWSGNKFPTARPFVGELLTFRSALHNLRATCVTREIPG